MWTSPIFDRTQADVDNRSPKGYLNVTDINRVEGNTKVLSDIFGLGLATKTWQRSDFPSVSELSRIRSNVEQIRNAYFIYSDTPQTPANPLTTYLKWNAIERILYDVHRIYMQHQTAIIFAGEIYSGENIGVI